MNQTSKYWILLYDEEIHLNNGNKNHRFVVFVLDIVYK